MSININNLTETELVDLNNRIVERLRFLHQARAHSRMLDFKIGDVGASRYGCRITGSEQNNSQEFRHV